MNNMADLRIHNFGDTANGKVSGSIPNVHVNQVKWENINPAENLLDKLMAEKALELSKAKQDLDEQKFAYGAANDEANRQNNIELQKIKNQNELDKVIQEYSLKSKMYNELKAEEAEKDKQANEYYGALEAFQNLVGDGLTPQEFNTAFREHHKWLGTPGLVDYFTNNPLEAENLNKLYMENRIKRDGVLEAMQKSSGNGSGNYSRNFRGKTNK